MAPRTMDSHPHSGLNRKIAVLVTNRTATMWTAYIFAAIALISLPAALMSHSLLVMVSWLAQTFIQLVLLPVIMVGQSVQQGHADAMAEVTERNTEVVLKKLDSLQTRLDLVAVAVFKKDVPK